MTFVGIFLIVAGVVSIVMPNVFRRTRGELDIAERNLSPARFTQYRRGLGFLFLVLGAALLIALR